MSSENTMEFNQAVEYMDPMQVTDYLHKILDFLKRDNHELYFPNISSYVETFLVYLVTNIDNLKCESLSDENKRFAKEIVEVLQVTKDTFRWTHSYENGKLTNNVLVYKKIYFNNVNKNATEPCPPAMASTRTQLNEPNTKQAASKARQSSKKRVTPSDIRRREKRAAMFAQAGSMQLPSVKQETVDDPMDSAVEVYLPECSSERLDETKCIDTKPPRGLKWTHSYENGHLAENILVSNSKNYTEPCLPAMDTTGTQLIQPNTKQPASKEAHKFSKKRATPSDIRRREKRAAMFAQAGSRQLPSVKQENKVSLERPIESLDESKCIDTKLTLETIDAKLQELWKCCKAKTETQHQTTPNDTQNKTKLSSLNATNSLNDLHVAVMTEPFAALTSDQVDTIIRTLESRIEAIGSSHEGCPYWPSFRGRPIHSGGVLKLQCEDTKDVEWLKDTVESVVSPIANTILVVKRQIDVPKRVKSAVFLH